MKKKFDQENHTLVQYAKDQIQLWKSFFPKLDQKELHTAVLSGLEMDMALQMNHYVSEETSTFLEYLELIDTHGKMAQQFENDDAANNYEEIGFQNDQENDAIDDEGDDGRVAEAKAETERIRTEKEDLVEEHQLKLQEMQDKLAAAEKAKAEAVEKTKRDETRLEKAKSDKAKAEKAKADAERELEKLKTVVESSRTSIANR